MTARPVLKCRWEKSTKIVLEGGERKTRVLFWRTWWNIREQGDCLECPKNLEVVGNWSDTSGLLPAGSDPVRRTWRPGHREPWKVWRNYSRKSQVGGSHYNLGYSLESRPPCPAGCRWARPYLKERSGMLLWLLFLMQSRGELV